MSGVAKSSDMALSVMKGKVDVNKGIHISLTCAGNQTKERIGAILSNYPDYLLVDEGLTFNLAIEQSIEILSHIRSTFICFDFKGAKKKIILDLAKTKIDKARQNFVIEGNSELDELDSFIVDNIGDIHLLNGILRVEIERNSGGGYLFRAKKFFSSCDRAKRANLRAELNSTSFAKGYFKPANGTMVMVENDFSIESINGIRIGIVKDISQKGLCIFLPRTKATNAIENGKEFTIVLPFLGMQVEFKVVKINRENKDFLELGGIILYSESKQEDMVAKYIFAREKVILQQFKAHMDGYEGIEKPVIESK